MDKARHCLICENQLIDYQKGSICGLSNEKPHFNEVCREISFGNKFNLRVEKVNDEFETLRKSNFVIYSYFIVFMLIGFAVIAAGLAFGYYAVDYMGNVRIISIVPVIIISAGVVVNVKAIATLVNHINQLKIARGYKVELDQLRALYNK